MGVGVRVEEESQSQSERERERENHSLSGPHPTFQMVLLSQEHLLVVNAHVCASPKTRHASLWKACFPLVSKKEA